MPPKAKPAYPLERRQWVSRLQKPVGSHCDGCVLQAIGSGFVRPRGPASKILLLGEAPGPEELKEGVPFVGPAGSMLERLFRFLGKDLSQYRVDNTIRCFPGDTLVQADGIERGFKRWYEGDLVTARTANGELSGTPNHPVLTTRGWVALGELTVGDHLIRGALQQGVRSGDPDVQREPARFAEAFDALAHTYIRHGVVGRDEDFHGDGRAAEVEVVTSDRFLRDRVQAARDQHLAQLILETSDTGLSDGVGLRTRYSAALAFLQGSDARTRRLISRADLLPAPFFRDAHPLHELSGRLVPQRDPRRLEQPRDYPVPNPEARLQGLDGLPAFVRSDEIREITRLRFASHVYNLQTRSAEYIANGYIVHNCIPPGMEMTGPAAASYAPIAIERCKYRFESISLPEVQVIVALGSTATKALLNLGKGAHMDDLHGTIHPWQDPYTGQWKIVVPTYHPSHLQRGANNMIGTVLYDLILAHEIAEGGWTQDPGVIVEDPPLDWFTLWVDQVAAAHYANPGSFWVTNDIETPDKAGGKSEGELGPDDQSYQILRQNFSCNPNEGLTVPYIGGYVEQCERLFKLANSVPDRPLPFLYWNEDYDRRRNAAAGHTLPEVSYDGMPMWHLLQSDVPQGLGFATPFYSRFGAWKHLAGSRPSYYAGVDGLQNQRTVYGIAGDLQEQGQWDIYLRHRVQVRKYALRPAEEMGLAIDEAKLDTFIEKLTTHTRGLFDSIQEQVPDALRPLVGNHKRKPEGAYTKATEYKKDGDLKKDPGDPLKRELYARAELFSQVISLDVQVCRVCGAVDIAKTHRCEESKVAPWAGVDKKLVAPIVQIEARQVERWFWKEPFNPDSRDQVMAYVLARGHKPGKAKKTHADTVDRKTLERLWKAEKDPFYKQMMDLRAVQKVRGTYGIGMKRRLKNGRVHGRITFRPSTQRTASQDPNLQNVVADKGDAKKSLAAGFRDCVVAATTPPAWVTQAIYDQWCDDWAIPRMPVREDPGCYLVETDFSGIEAKVIGWCANDPAYIRLAGLGPHACLALYASGKPPDLSLPDAELKKLFDEIKSTGGPADDPILYDRSKRVCHGSAYGLTAHGMANTFDQFFTGGVKQAERLLAIFYNQMAPKIRDFHKSVRLQAHRDHYLGGMSHPFRYKHWFWSVLQYRMITAAQAMTRRKNGGWVETINGRDFAVDWGDDSKRAIAFFPQSIAAGILMEAMLKLFLPWITETYIGNAYYGQTPLRAPIHDSLLQEIPKRIAHAVIRRVLHAKTLPIPELPMPAEWNMGSHLAIGVDAKYGEDWGHMSKWDPTAAWQPPATVTDATVFIEDDEDDEMIDSLVQTEMTI